MLLSRELPHDPKHRVDKILEQRAKEVIFGISS
jgi:hypothetical protein